jgi:hypothetical protein
VKFQRAGGPEGKVNRNFQLRIQRDPILMMLRLSSLSGAKTCREIPVRGIFLGRSLAIEQPVALGCILNRSVPVFAFLRLQGLTQTGVRLLPVSPLIRYFGAFCYEYFMPPPGKDPTQPFRALIHAPIQRSALFSCLQQRQYG